MKKMTAQRKGKTLIPFSREDLVILKKYKENQPIGLELRGIQDPRSVEQNKAVHAVFRRVASSTDDPDWDTPEKVKRMVKLAMKFFKDDVVVSGNKVFFELRSFAFDKMTHQEANLKFTEALAICAGKLGITIEELEAEIKSKSKQREI